MSKDGRKIDEALEILGSKNAGHIRDLLEGAESFAIEVNNGQQVIHGTFEGKDCYMSKVDGGVLMVVKENDGLMYYMQDEQGQMKSVSFDEAQIVSDGRKATMSVESDGMIFSSQATTRRDGTTKNIHLSMSENDDMDNGKPVEIDSDIKVRRSGKIKSSKFEMRMPDDEDGESFYEVNSKFDKKGRLKSVKTHEKNFSEEGERNIDTTYNADGSVKEMQIKGMCFDGEIADIKMDGSGHILDGIVNDGDDVWRYKNSKREYVGEVLYEVNEAKEYYDEIKERYQQVRDAYKEGKVRFFEIEDKNGHGYRAEIGDDKRIVVLTQEQYADKEKGIREILEEFEQDLKDAKEDLDETYKGKTMRIVGYKFHYKAAADMSKEEIAERVARKDEMEAFDPNKTMHFAPEQVIVEGKKIISENKRSINGGKNGEQSGTYVCQRFDDGSMVLFSEVDGKKHGAEINIDAKGKVSVGAVYAHGEVLNVQNCQCDVTRDEDNNVQSVDVLLDGKPFGYSLSADRDGTPLLGFYEQGGKVIMAENPLGDNRMVLAAALRGQADKGGESPMNPKAVLQARKIDKKTGARKSKITLVKRQEPISIVAQINDRSAER